MNGIFLNDLLRLEGEELNCAKIKFNKSNGYHDPMELYKENPEIVNTNWLLAKSERDYFKEGQIAICFLKLSSDFWLLTTIKKITKKLDVEEGAAYEGEELEQYSPYYARVIIKYHKHTRSQGLYYKTIYKELEVNQILPNSFDGDEFPGYDKVRLSYDQLATIIRRGKRDWIAALENQKAVYLITDKSNGKLYVGSATSDQKMLLQRWSDYINNGHGGNKKLKALVEEKGFDYIKENFQYSILENYNARVEDKVIWEREEWWKETLQSIVYGYNGN